MLVVISLSSVHVRLVASGKLADRVRLGAVLAESGLWPEIGQIPCCGFVRSCLARLSKSLLQELKGPVLHSSTPREYSLLRRLQRESENHGPAWSQLDGALTSFVTASLPRGPCSIPGHQQSECTWRLVVEKIGLSTQACFELTPRSLTVWCAFALKEDNSHVTCERTAQWACRCAPRRCDGGLCHLVVGT